MTRTRLSHHTARRARSTASTAALWLSVLALAACSGGASEPAASTAAPVESAASDAGGSSAPSATEGGTPTESSTDASASSSPSAGSTGSEKPSASEKPSGSASGSYLTDPGPISTGDIATTGVYGMLIETGTSEDVTLPAGKGSDLGLSEEDGTWFEVVCEQDLQLGGEPVPCDYVKEGAETLKGEAVYVRIAGGTNTMVVGHVFGSEGKDPALVASGETGLLMGDYGTGPASPDVVTDEGLAQELLEAYHWNFEREGPLREGIEATCSVEDGGLRATCDLSGAKPESNGEYTAIYQPGEEGDAMYIFSPTSRT